MPLPLDVQGTDDLEKARNYESLVQISTTFLISLQRCYGNEKALAIWDSFRAHVGDDLAGDTMFKMMSRNGRYRMSWLHPLPVGGSPKIENIKIFRQYMQIGLKEAKDIVDTLNTRSSVELDLSSVPLSQHASLINECARAGLIIS